MKEVEKSNHQTKINIISDSEYKSNGISKERNQKTINKKYGLNVK